MSRAEDLLGMILREKFRVESVVSEATDFFVFAGRETTTDVPVTIRVVRALRGSSEEELRDAFDQFAIEAEQLAQVSKAAPANVEQLLASGEGSLPGDRERFAYCVFARTDGTSLAQLTKTKGGAQPLGRVIRALQPIADVLAIAHDQGAYHGDVRPENLILVEAARDPTIKIVRFTLGTRLGSPTRTFSPAYGAPEHFKRSYGDSSIGPPTDVYGLALCVVELVTGRPPFEGSHQSELYKQTTDITRRPTLLARGATGVSAAVDGVMAKALAVNPKLRFPNAAAFWQALVAAVGEAVMAESGPSLIAPIESSSDPIAEALGPVLTPQPTPVPTPTPTRTPRPSSHPSLTEAEAPPPPPSSSAPDLPPPPPPPQPPGLSRTTLAGVLGAGFAVLAVGIVFLVIALSSKKQTTSNLLAVASSAAAAAEPSSIPVADSSSASSSPPPPPTTTAAPEGMIRIEPGTFVMGKDTEGKGDRPAHKVKLTKAFYLDRTEVTAEAYGACVEAGACERRTLHVGKKIQGAWGCNQEKAYANHPANCVDRQQASTYCAWVKKRLPTEAEWEYAARGTDERDFPWGSTTPATCAQGVISGLPGGCGERKGTFPVGSAPEGKSPFGVQDMAGNVWEWVADDYTPYPDGEITDPMSTVPSVENLPTKGILRGGSWDYGAQAAKTTYRLPFVAEAGNGSIGLRCARTAE